MKIYALIDDDNIVRCMASDQSNLHPDKIAAGMTTYYVERGGIVGDEYDPQAEIWTAHPENYPE